MYRELEIKELQARVKINALNQVKCDRNVEELDGQLVKLNEKLEHETEKLSGHGAALAELKVRLAYQSCHNEGP